MGFSKQDNIGVKACAQQVLPTGTTGDAEAMTALNHRRAESQDFIQGQATALTHII